MNLDKIVNVLKNDGIVVIPTDTVYGISCNALSTNAVKKIYELKNRDYSKPMIVLMSSVDMLKKYCIIDDPLEEELINKYYPGELTIILKKKDIIPNIISSNQTSLAVRIPNNKDLLDIITKLDKPIVSTSANLSKEDVITDISLLPESIKNNVDYVHDGGYINNPPSTIIKVENNKIHILREGLLTNDIKGTYKNKIC